MKPRCLHCLGGPCCWGQALLSQKAEYTRSYAYMPAKHRSVQTSSTTLILGKQHSICTRQSYRGFGLASLMVGVTVRHSHCATLTSSATCCLTWAQPGCAVFLLPSTSDRMVTMAIIARQQGTCQQKGHESHKALCENWGDRCVLQGCGAALLIEPD